MKNLRIYTLLFSILVITAGMNAQTDYSGTVYDLNIGYSNEYDCEYKYLLREINVTPGSLVKITVNYRQYGTYIIKSGDNNYQLGEEFVSFADKIYLYYEIIEWDPGYHALSSDYPLYHFTMTTESGYGSHEKLYLEEGKIVSPNGLTLNTNYGNIQFGPFDSSWAHIYSDRANFLFNKSLYTATGAFSSGTNSNLMLQTGGTTRLMVSRSNGNIGIGIDTPQVKLHINNDGAILAQGAYGSGWNETNLGAGTRMLWYPRKAAFRVGHVNGTQWDNNNIGNYSFANGFNTISSGTSSVAMGHDSKATNSYAIAMGMQANASNMSALALGYQTTASGKYSTSLGYVSRATGEHSLAMGKWVNATETNSMVIGLGASSQDRLVNNTPNSLIIGFNTSTPTLFVGSKVGIGTDQPDSELTVNGVIHAKEIKIELSGPLADYVFSPNYSLMPLYEVETFVKTNQHLPEIPSAMNVKDNGLHLGEMQNKLLQKIEELTLYVIEQQKQIDALKARLDEK